MGLIAGPAHGPTLNELESHFLLPWQRDGERVGHRSSPALPHEYLPLALPKPTKSWGTTAKQANQGRDGFLEVTKGQNGATGQRGLLYPFQAESIWV